MLQNLLNDKKKLTYAIVAAVLIIAVVATGTYFIVKHLNGDKSQTTSQLKADADTLMDQAMEAKRGKDYSKATALLQQAREKYVAAGDTMNITDVDGQLALIKFKTENAK